MRILAVDDNPIIRMGLRTLLDGTDGVTSVIDTGDPDEAVTRVRAGQVDVVLLDVRMPRMSGLELLPRLSDATVVMLTHTDDPSTVSEALAAGAAGYLVHGALEPAAMVDAIRLCRNGSQVVSGVSRGTPAPAAAAAAAVRGLLSRREAEVMDLVADGQSNREVAALLFISEKTVKNHVNSLFAKLAVTTRSQAIVRWLQLGPDAGSAVGPAGTGPSVGPRTLGARPAAP
ncbi:two component transcriptional regulator, LuxR family [Promicromonospora umidemergens]|uniref:Response regulator transcription factor n=1 Tax=Promicromonospora umidemergens TaxID=629679 RepID=A0ABP8XFB2_9MICO|nr:response regulator transcription factor [Promicromonospora umidemergens]MCP2283116.1 two component transcriptional regulator, LuxR family [Promicromonospora umidemergens]